MIFFKLPKIIMRILKSIFFPLFKNLSEINMTNKYNHSKLVCKYIFFLLLNVFFEKLLQLNFIQNSAKMNTFSNISNDQI